MKNLELLKAFSPSVSAEGEKLPYTITYAKKRKVSIVYYKNPWTLFREMPYYNIWQRKTAFGDVIKQCFSKGINPNDKNYFEA